MMSRRSLSYGFALTLALLLTGLFALAGNGGSGEDVPAASGAASGPPALLFAPVDATEGAAAPCRMVGPLPEVLPEDAPLVGARAIGGASAVAAPLHGLTGVADPGLVDPCLLFEGIAVLPERIEPPARDLAGLAGDLVEQVDEVDALRLLRCDPEAPREYAAGPASVTFTCEGRPLLEVLLEQVDEVVDAVNETLEESPISHLPPAEVAGSAVGDVVAIVAEGPVPPMGGPVALGQERGEGWDIPEGATEAPVGEIPGDGAADAVLTPYAS